MKEHVAELERQKQVRAKKPKQKQQKGKTKIRHQIKTPAGQMITTPWQGSLASSNGGDSGSGVGSTLLLNGAAAASELRKILLDPWADNSMGRWPDAYTMIPTFTSKDVVHLSMTISNGTSAADGGAGMYVRGDSSYTYRQASSIAAGPGYEMKWNSVSESLNAALPVGSLCRPVGAGFRYTFSGVGPYHSIVARVIELPPWPYIVPTDSPTNFPTAAHLGPTFAQREFMRAREIVMVPGDSLNLICLPAGVPGLNFCMRGSDRESGTQSIYGTSWAGFVVWFFGLSSTDTLYCDGVFHHEYYLPSAATMPSVTNNTRAITKPDVQAVQNVESEVVDLASTGWNVFKSIVSDTVDLFRALTPLFSGGSPGGLTRAPSCSPTGTLAQESLSATFGKTLEVKEDLAPIRRGVTGLRPPIPSDSPANSAKSSSSSAADEFEDLSKSCLLKELKKRL